MKDINEILPKIPQMRWGALLNTPPTNKRIEEMNNIFPNNGKWHTVFEENEQITIDGKQIHKKDPNKWT